MEVLTLENGIPENLDIEWYDEGDAHRAKRMKRDGLLSEYYTQDYQDDGVVRVGKSESTGLILEKQMKSETEPHFTLLAEALGIGPEVYYLRHDEEEDQIYAGVEFLKEFGMPEDLDYDGMDDFLDYAYTIGQTLGPLWDVGVMQDDLIRTEKGEEYGNTAYLTNIMLSGPDDEAAVIDMERSHFEEHETREFGTNMNETVEDEIEAVESALVSQAVRSFDDIIEELYLDKESAENLFAPGPNSMYRTVDPERMPAELESDIFETGEEEDEGRAESSAVREFRRGLADGTANPLKMEDRMSNNKVINVGSLPQEPEDAARELYRQLDGWLAQQLFSDREL
ncbi:MAG: hypothetical protein ABEJ91_01300 [Candidatus Nanohaloarchaea archaeon]